MTGPYSGAREARGGTVSTNDGQPHQPGQPHSGGGQQPPPFPPQMPPAPGAQYPAPGPQYAGAGFPPNPGYGQPPTGYPAAPPTPPKKKGRGLMWGLIAGGALVIVIAAIVLALFLQQRAAEQAEADRAESIAGAASGYLEALAAGDAEAALAYIDGQETSPLLSDEALAVSLETSPISEIDVPPVQDDGDYGHWEVPVSYRIGDTSVSTTMSVTSLGLDDGEYLLLGGTLPTINIPEAYLDLGATVNGVAVDSATTAVFPGTYELGVDDDRFEIGGTTSVTLTEPVQSASFSEAEFALDDATTTELRDLVREEVEECVAQTSLEAGCGLTMEATINSGDVTLEDGTVSRALPADTRAALDSLTFEPAYDNPLRVTSGSIGSVDLEADSTDGGRYEVWFGGPSLGPVTIDLAGDDPTLYW